jgi:hypothetical protein
MTNSNRDNKIEPRDDEIELQLQCFATAAELLHKIEIERVAYYGGDPNKGVWPIIGELHLMLYVRQNDAANQPPLSLRQLQVLSHMPYETLRRCVKSLVKRGAVSDGRGVSGRDDFIQQRLVGNYAQRTADAIHLASRKLTDLGL